MQEKHFLHEFVRNTNLERPFNPSIGLNIFPAQEDDLGSVIPMKFVDESFVPMTDQPGEFYDRIFQKDFIVARSDKFSVYKDAKKVYISTDYKKIIILEQDKIVTPLNVPESKEYLLGMKVFPEYRDGSREAYIIAIQGLDPGFAVIAEYVDESTYRILLDTDLYFTYNPSAVDFPTLQPNPEEIRKKILEGRVPFNG